MSGQETIASRFIKLNQLILGKSNTNIPNKFLAHRDGLLDVLFALYEECNVDYMRKDKHIASFVDKFKGLMIELKSLRANLRDFEVKKIIGRGHFGEVQVVREKATGDVYAMKILRKEETLSQQNVAFYKEERDIMSLSSSPWLTKLQYSFQDSHNLYLVMEFHPGGDMLSLLEKYDNVLPEDMCQFYLAELVLAIHSLHSMGYVHRDIKPDNILIDRTGHIKLADFGSASKLNPHKQVTSCMPVGTPDYVAPEVLAAMNPGPISCKSYGIECDWWSLGIVTYEMVFGLTPFADDKVLVTYNNIMNYKNSLHFPPEASDISEALINLIKDLLKDASNRSGYDQLIVHPLFTDIDWNNIRHIAPPFVPTVTSVDDTSNFDDFQPESRPYLGDLKCKKEFTGKNLPFVGFTYTIPFETKVERLSSADDVCIFSPSSSFCDLDNDRRKKEIASLQSTVTQLSTVEECLREEINKFKMNSDAKDRELEKMKSEKKVQDQMIEELNAEVQQMKQLLVYEREHRVITEQKASQLVRCMKTKQKQDALRLRAKSLEFNKGEKEINTLEEQLEEALSKIDEFVRERAELLEDLEATKHMLLKCQRNIAMKEPVPSCSSSGEKNKSSCFDKSQLCAMSENKFELEAHDLRRLIYKLEKKNVQLEKDLDDATSAKKEKEASNIALRSTVSKLESEIKELEKQFSNMKKENLSTEGPDSGRKSLKAVCDTTDSKESSVQEVTSDFSEDSSQEISSNSEISVQEEKSTEANAVQVDMTPVPLKAKENYVSLSIAPMKNIDIPSQIVKPFEDCKVSLKNALQDVTNKQKKSISLEATSDLKQENEYLKTRIEVLTVEIAKLTEAVKNTENSHTDCEKMIKEKETALNEAKLDLRISTRKEQQSECLTSSLRERNKELREKVKSLEEAVNEKTVTENELRRQLKSVESELCEKSQEITEKQKLLEIEKAKHEERVKAMQYTCEMSKDVTQKFARSQDHYEEVIKQNMDLMREKEEACKSNSSLVKEIEALKKELSKKKNEYATLEKVHKVLKSSCVEMEEHMNDFEIIVEARDKTIQELHENENKLKSDLKSLEEALRLSKTDMKKAEKKSEELVKHIEELTSEMDSNNFLLETEMQNVQEQLTYYKKIALDMEQQNAAFQKELSLQNSDCKSYSEKILYLESQLCEIKEEAARHITQISSLKASNLKLTQALEDALEHNKDEKQNNEDLSNELESIKANNLLEKVKLQETISQQVKLIDFLQSKTENIEKRKKPNISRLFGRKENSNVMPMQYRDVEKLLETEKSRCRRLQDHLSQARAENVALQKEINNIKNSTTNVEVPVSPVSRAMHCVITQSPCADNDCESPVLVSRELINKFSKPPGMKHKIPHRFTNIMCMRSTKCSACLDSLHFGRPVAKCQECFAICHPNCAASLPSTCGLPSAFMQHFKTAVSSSSSSDTVESGGNRISDGWVKVPKSNKLGWDRRYLRIVDNSVLYLFENSDERDSSRAIVKLDFSPKVARIVVTSAVSATELTYAASSDLPYVLKLEYFPHTTCWPQRCLYIMAENFTDKQMWVSTLEDLADENQREVDSCQKNRLVGKAIWSMKGERLIDPLCTTILDDNIVLLGAMDGLYVLKIVNKFTCSLKCKIDGPQYIYQIACLKDIGLVIFIQGNERRLTMTQLSSVQSAVQKLGNSSLVTKPLSDISDCHLFSVEDSFHPDSPYLCIATPKSVTLYQWDDVLKTFCNKKVFETKEPCSCLHFTSRSLIFGSDSFYEVDLNIFTVKKFFDDQDASLAGVIYGASHFRSFPIAIFQVSSPDEPVEYLMCFHEMGVFVNGNGQRTREEDMKWSRLPLSFAYQLPYLFVTHFNSLEVIEIPPQNAIELGLQAVMSIQNPQHLGPAHVDQSVYFSSCHDQLIELILVDGKSIGRSDFNIEKTSTATCSASSSGKESITESDGLDFSFSTSVDQSLAEISEDQISVSSRDSSETAFSQS